MKNSTYKILACSIILLCTLQAEAQQRQKQKPVLFGKDVQRDNGIIPCASTEYEAYLVAKHPQLNREDFEEWMASKIKSTQNRFNTKNTNTVITIPVVFHVIHNGDPIGTDENISDEQVLSQLEVLNEDFRRMLDTPGFNDHPDGADVEIEFCLAQRDPGGSPTTGIEHINMGRPSWNSFEDIDNVLKAQTLWDTENYLNIWVCKMGGMMEGVGGYAYFPEASGLPGLGGSEGNADIDGVILAFYGTGSSDIYPQGTYSYGRDKGRSATHEIGHFFGLRHIWGDENNCTATDYCEDTPPAANLNFNCFEYDSCPEDESPDMIENYMDYTTDECKNIFTNDQKTRIWTVLENSPRRMSLATSNSCVFPEGVEHDGSLNINDIDNGCTGSFTVYVQLTNIGSGTINQAIINYSIDGGAVQTYNWTGTLATNETEEIAITDIETVAGEHIFSTDIVSVNTIADVYEFNDTKTREFTALDAVNYNTTTVTFNLQQDVFGNETTWMLQNSNGEILYEGGPYEDTDVIPGLLTQIFELPDNECYTFTINDSFGDGICCESGDGYYSLLTDDGTLIATGGGYGFGEKVKFGKNIELNSPDFNNNLNIHVYPNPVKNMLYVTIPQLQDEGTYKIYNTLGQLVATGDSTFEQGFGIDTSVLSQGVYILNINAGGKNKSIKFIKE